jgi:hypothetical protein
VGISSNPLLLKGWGRGERAEPLFDLSFLIRIKDDKRDAKKEKNLNDESLQWVYTQSCHESTNIGILLRNM